MEPIPRLRHRRRQRDRDGLVVGALGLGAEGGGVDLCADAAPEVDFVAGGQSQDQVIGGVAAIALVCRGARFALQAG